MKLHFTLIAFTFFSLSAFSQKNKKLNPKDLAVLQQIPIRWERYWNNHNMDSMGTLLATNVDFVTVAGTWLKGKGEAVTYHQKNHATIFKTSIWTTDSVSIKFIKPDLALMHISWGISGDFDPDGTTRTPRHGIFSWLISKTKNQWLILAVHNVNKRESTTTVK
jgi:uncharacterized protein (TIGR02246 family)